MRLIAWLRRINAMPGPPNWLLLTMLIVIAGSVMLLMVSGRTLGP